MSSANLDCLFPPLKGNVYVAFFSHLKVGDYIVDVICNPKRNLQQQVWIGEITKREGENIFVKYITLLVPKKGRKFNGEYKISSDDISQYENVSMNKFEWRPESNGVVDRKYVNQINSDKSYEPLTQEERWRLHLKPKKKDDTEDSMEIDPALVEIAARESAKEEHSEAIDKHLEFLEHLAESLEEIEKASTLDDKKLWELQDSYSETHPPFSKTPYGGFKLDKEILSMQERVEHLFKSLLNKRSQSVSKFLF